jgi:hypothetical protein
MAFYMCSVNLAELLIPHTLSPIIVRRQNHTIEAAQEWNEESAKVDEQMNAKHSNNIEMSSLVTFFRSPPSPLLLHHLILHNSSSRASAMFHVHTVNDINDELSNNNKFRDNFQCLKFFASSSRSLSCVRRRWTNSSSHILFGCSLLARSHFNFIRECQPRSSTTSSSPAPRRISILEIWSESSEPEYLLYCWTNTCENKEEEINEIKNKSQMSINSQKIVF